MSDVCDTDVLSRPARDEERRQERLHIGCATGRDTIEAIIACEKEASDADELFNEPNYCSQPRSVVELKESERTQFGGCWHDHLLYRPTRDGATL